MVISMEERLHRLEQSGSYSRHAMYQSEHRVSAKEQSCLSPVRIQSARVLANCGKPPVKQEAVIGNSGSKPNANSRRTSLTIATRNRTYFSSGRLNAGPSEALARAGSTSSTANGLPTLT